MQVLIDVSKLAKELAESRLLLLNKSQDKKEVYSDEIQLDFDKYYSFYVEKISKLGVQITLIDYIKDKIVEHEYFVNNEMLFLCSDEEKDIDNIDFVMRNKGGSEIFNIGYEQAKRHTYFEILRFLE